MTDDPGHEEEMACAELVELVTDFLEDALSEDRRRRVVEHLSGCGGCAAYLAQMRAVLAVAASSPPERLSPHARERALAVFRAWDPQPPGD